MCYANKEIVNVVCVTACYIMDTESQNPEYLWKEWVNMIETNGTRKIQDGLYIDVAMATLVAPVYHL